MSSKVDSSRFAITAEAILYTTFNKELGLQFFKLYLHSFGLGKHVIIPCFGVTDKEPVL